MKTLLFSANGRIGRGQYWKGILVSLVLNVVVVGVLSVVFGAMMSKGAAGEGDTGASAMVPSLLLSLVFVGSFVFATWSSICLGIKRLHDHGKPGVLILLAFVPVANIWIIILTAFLKGTEGPNAYGPDPLVAGSRSGATPLSYAPAR